MNRFACIVFAMFTCCSCNNNETKNKEVVTESKSTVSQVVGIGKIEPEHEIIQLTSPVTGIVLKILKKENDSVEEGTPILELDHQLEDAKVRQLNTEVKTQIEQVKMDESGVGEYEVKYANAATELERLQKLLSSGSETQQTVDNASTNLKTYLSNIQKLKAGVAVSKGRLKQIVATLNVAEIERDQKIIRSPVKGKILEIGTLPGSGIDTRDAFAQICPTGKTIAVCEIDELYADKVSLGQKAWIRNFGTQDTLSSGYVYHALYFLKKKSLFTDQSGEKEDRRVRTIKIMLDNPEGLLLNARVECVIDISDNLKK